MQLTSLYLPTSLQRAASVFPHLPRHTHRPARPAQPLFRPHSQPMAALPISLRKSEGTSQLSYLLSPHPSPWRPFVGFNTIFSKSLSSTCSSSNCPNFLSPFMIKLLKCHPLLSSIPLLHSRGHSHSGFTHHSTKTALGKVCLAPCCQIQWSVLSPLLDPAAALVTAHHSILLKLLGHFVSRLSYCRPVSLPLRGCSFAVSFPGSSSSPDLLGSEWPRAQALGRLIS